MSMFGAVAAHYVDSTPPPPSGYLDACKADGVSAIYLCTETSGTTLADSSGNARTLTITGTPTAMGLAGPKTGLGAIQWPQSQAIYATGPSVASGNILTLEAWVYLTAAPTASTTLVATSSNVTGANGNNNGLMVASNGTPGFYTWNAVQTLITGPTALTLNTWHHLVGVSDANGSHLRVDKVQVASQTRGLQGNTAPIRVHAGGQSQGGGACIVSAPALYLNTALSDARIDAHYDAT